MSWYDPTSWFNNSDNASNAGTAGVSGMNSDLSAALSKLSATDQATLASKLNSGTGLSGIGGGKATNGLDTGFGWNIGTGQLAISGLSTLGQLWTAWNAVDLANKNYNLTKATSQANLNNQVTTYNNNLEDRISSRYAAENKTSADASAYIDSHKLSKVNL